MREPDPPPLLPPGLPLTLTVAEAAEWLRISKGGVYALVHRGIATNGAEGLPIVKLGLDRTWRIPTIAVLRLVGVIDEPAHPKRPADLRSLRSPGHHGAA